ncbi:MAG: HisA/HisF-related TIM barrel protein [Spirochaetia bacterium]|nr:HisA/HisF-related TIM barrel protein [Spirochaetia bacterium]
MNLIPALDIIENCVVRLTQGDYNQKKIYSDNPVAVARKFKDSGVKRLHLVDLDGAREGKPVHTTLFGEIKKQTQCIIEAGGGIRSLEDFEQYFQCGLNVNEDFIMIGSLPLKEPDEFKKIRNKYLRNILLTVDVWERNVKISGWKVDTNIHIMDYLKDMEKLGIKNILVTQIKRDGMLTGPDIDLYKEISKQFPSFKTIVSGGISNINEASDLNLIPGINGFIVGRAFYENKISLNDIQKYHS